MLLLLLLLEPSVLGFVLGTSLRFRCLLGPRFGGPFLAGAKGAGVRKEMLLDAGNGFGSSASSVAEELHTVDELLRCWRGM